MTVTVTWRALIRFRGCSHGIERQSGILVLAVTSILNVAQADAEIRRLATNPDAGPTAPQTIGAQLSHQPTQAEKRAQGAFAAALERAKRFDASNDRAACTGPDPRQAVVCSIAESLLAHHGP
jgi:hypothetical protein